MEAVNITYEDTCKANFLRKYNPDEAYPFWENKMARELDEVEKEIRADERAKVLDEVLRKHNNCNTDLCEYVNTNISCCDCIVRKLKEQK